MAVGPPVRIRIVLTLIAGAALIGCTSAASPTLTPAPLSTGSPTPAQPASPMPAMSTVATPRLPESSAALGALPAGPTESAVVLRVIDGDTIEVDRGNGPETVRYIGVDTPETVAPGAPIEWMGPEASAANAALVEGQRVVLERARGGRVTTPRSPAADLLRSVDLDPEGPVSWGTSPSSRSPGVYIVETLTALAEAPLDMHLIQGWLASVPTLQVDGTRPTVERLAARLAEFWIPDQRIVYIGLTTGRLSGRLSGYYRTPLGDERPHAGGHWIRTLAGLENFWVWWSETSDPVGCEDELLTAFARQVPAEIRSGIRGSDLVLLPFANKENAAKTLRKPHGITKSTRRAPTVARQVTPSVPAQISPEARLVGRPRGTLAEINAALQEVACAGSDGRVAAVPAAAELKRRDLLPDSRQRPGKPLRDLLRAGVIEHAYQEPNSRWWISCAGSAAPPRQKA